MKLLNNSSFSEFLSEQSVYDDMGNVKILKRKDFKYYYVQTEEIEDSKVSETPTKLGVAYTIDGDHYIGNSDDAKMLETKYDIKPEPISKDHKICSIGFSEKNQKWYGWSHRAIFGFGIGHKVKLGDANYRASNQDEFVEKIKSWYKDPMYSNLSISKEKEGVRIKYEILHEVKADKFQETLHPLYEASKSKTDFLEPWPEKWGKGEWEAHNLNECKEMAIDFAKSVS